MSVQEIVDRNREDARQVVRDAIAHRMPGLGALDRGDRHLNVLLEAPFRQIALAQQEFFAQRAKHIGVQQHTAVQDDDGTRTRGQR